MEEYKELDNIKNCVCDLGLKLLGKQWPRDMADKQYLELVKPPSLYNDYTNSEHELKRLYTLSKAIKVWRRNTSNNITQSWKQLSTVIPVTSIAAIINYTVLRANKDWKKYDERATGIVASRLYLELLGVPGSGAYSIYHPRLFVNCLKIFILPFTMLEQDDFYIESSDVDQLNAQLERLFNDFLELIDTFDFSVNDDESVEEALAILVEYISYTQIDRRSDLNKNNVRKLEEKAIHCIDKLVTLDEDQYNDETIVLIFKAILPKFTAIFGNKKHLAQWRNAGMNYITSIVNKYKNSSTAGLTCLIQHLSYSKEGLERIESRTNRVKMVMRLLALMPIQPYLDLLKWFIKLSRNSKPILRLFALEVLGCIITGTDRTTDEAMNVVNEQEDATFLQFHDTLCETIDEDDQTAEQTPQLSQDHQKVAHKDLLLVIYERCQDMSSSVRTKAVSLLAICTKPENDLLKPVIQDIFEDELQLFEMAALRMNDEKVSVRKAAISMMENLFCNNSSLLTTENLQVLVLHCRDASLMVRCAAITSLTFLITNRSCQAVVEAWLAGPLHQLSDPEVKVQDMVIEHLKKILFNPLTKHPNLTATKHEKLPWQILLGIIKRNLRKYLSRACTNIAKTSKVIDKPLVNILKTHIGTENNLKAWVLLSCLVKHVQTTDVEFVLKYFNELNQSQQTDIRLLTLVLEVLCEWSSSIPLDCRSELNENLIKGLQNRTFPAGATRAIINLTLRLSRDTVWIDSLIQKCEQDLFLAVETDSEINGFTILVMADLFLVSDLKPTLKLVDTLRKIITSIDEDIADNTKAQALVALGKISLREQSTAAISAPLCADVLSSATYPLSIKINAMCVLADLCVRFTSIVEPLMPGVCICLGSSNLTLRKSAVNLVTQLLVGDFLRLKGSLYFHYFSLMCDDNEEIRDVITYYIQQCLTQKNKNIIYHNFVECLFYYNNFEGHDTYGKTLATDEERKLFILQGEGKRSTRHTIYEVMISEMTDMQRMNLQMKICSVVETVLRSGQEGLEILRDIIVTLRKAAKPVKSKQDSDDIAVRVTTNIVSQKMKMNMVDVVVPTIMKLYRELNTAESLLMSDVVAYACDLLKDFKEEIEQADAELLEEMKVLQNSQSANTPHKNLTEERRVANIPDFIDDDNMDEPSNILREFEGTVSSTPIAKKTKPRIRSGRVGKTRTPNKKIPKRSLK